MCQFTNNSNIKFKLNLSAIIVKLTVILVLFSHINYAFNISPQPNLILREPKTSKLLMEKTRSSYFGFSINLKRDR